MPLLSSTTLLQKNWSISKSDDKWPVKVYEFIRRIQERLDCSPSALVTIRRATAVSVRGLSFTGCRNSIHTPTERYRKREFSYKIRTTHLLQWHKTLKCRDCTYLCILLLCPWPFCCPERASWSSAVDAWWTKPAMLHNNRRRQVRSGVRLPVILHLCVESWPVSRGHHWSNYESN